MKVGVALCTYQGARFVETQVGSILEQPETAQLALGDDGSTDGTVDLVRDTIAVSGRDDVDVRVLPIGERLGVTANFERTTQALATDLIALSDQDDRWHPGRLAAIAERFQADPTLLLIFTDADLVDADGAPLGSTLFGFLELGEGELAALRDGDAFPAFIRRNLATGATVVFRRELLAAALPFPSSWVHDEWLAVVAAALGGVAVVEDRTIDYRLHGGNQIGVATPTLRHKLSRILERRGDRNRVLAARFEELARRLETIDGVPVSRRTAAQAKAAFETRRAAFPPNRLRRALPVLRLAATGEYARYASRGSADILRDLIQPA
jgi:glycosyltransferase involved in cell wall biosynthesis